ncbi:unnamed protein product [Caenorhabditis bovis]|uniref:Major facilitator superfamily (MFS) profile domain-containing protein n=1 Tax=Caenorhabditis bovis TaxID=2654633 RepID=A0A8S1F0K6_9PELO|nr:unnamed protein product [Caenorhabditis bovis]
MVLSGAWRLDALITIFYQMSLFFSVQLLFVIFLDYMPRTTCDADNYCYKLNGKCMSNYDKNLPSLCPANDTKFLECVEDKKRLDFISAQYEYQHGCTGLRSFSISTVTFIGTLFGNTVLGSMADKLGRKPAYLTALAIGIPSIVLAAAVPGVTAFYIFRLLAGFAVSGTMTVGWTYGSEMISPSMRLRLRTFPNWANARMMQVAVAYFTGEWRLESYWHSGLSLILVPIMLFLPESPVFLEQKQKYDEAHAARAKIARICNLPYSEKEIGETKKLKKVTIGRVFRSPHLRKNFLVLCWMWFYVGTCVYITDLNGGDMSKNFYVGQFFSGFMLSISRIAVGIAEPNFKWLGRRLLFLTAQGISLICYIIILVALYTDSKSQIWYTITYICAYSFQSLCLEPCYLCLAELMPTDVRTTVGAVVNILMKIGTIIATTTVPLKYSYEPALFWINLALGAFGWIVIYIFLEESRFLNLLTVGQEDVSEEAEIVPDDGAGPTRSGSASNSKKEN